MFATSEPFTLTPSEMFVILMAVVAAVGVLAKGLKLPYPILLVVGGLLLSFQPWLPAELVEHFRIPPELVLFAFLPPLLYAAAFNTDWPSFRQQLRSISLLAVGLTLFTMTAVAAACHFLLHLDWPVGFLLGAIVSPPDAVAAAAITSRVKVPRVIGTILEGESLVNDATALVAFRLALGAVLSGVFVWWECLLQFVMVSVGGILLGIIGAVAVIWLHRLLNRFNLADSKLTIVITLLTPYAVYLPAEHLHVSGVLAAVAAGLWVGSRCERVFTHELYIEAKAVWEMVDFVLNGIIFLLIGFQLPRILEGLSTDGNSWSPEWLTFASVVIVVVVVVARMVWVFPGAYLPRWMDRRVFGSGDPYPPWQQVVVVGWTGMRGVVSLAVALALPEHGPPDADGHPTAFPFRDLILFLTFVVIFATLVGQGLTLPLIIRWLKVDKAAEAEPEEVVGC